MATSEDDYVFEALPPEREGDKPDLASKEKAQKAGRYRIEGKLGAGAMGEVFKAFDPDLGRPVALKFLRGDDPALLARFQQEAKAQARLDSKHICKVYEVGEANGRRYISMQYIAGQTLAAAAKLMTLEQKVAVLRDVAEAVQSANKQGLIHRDIKPANIMVEKTEEGGWHAYVMDFGLAQDQTTEGLTMTGMILGTPGFMAPEQLRGEVRSLDRRADVYSLGATLYAALSGCSPFAAAGAMDVMLQVLESEPTSLSKLDSNIPADLNTIVMKCLEKEPHRRYDSARALAEDLQRFLEGEPIHARRSSLLYRLKKKAQKHRGLVAVGATATVLLLILGGYGLRSQMRAAQREVVARSFGQQMKEIESLMRISHLARLHDTRPEKKLIRNKMSAIEHEDLGGTAEGPKQYALGKGHLVLRELQPAREHLQRAWDTGYRAPEVAYALGQVLGGLYNKELKQAERLGSDELIQERRKVLQKQYRDPALSYLKQSRGVDLEAPEYLEALLAFYEQRYSESLQKAQQVSSRQPWMYEARLLQGDIYVSSGDEQSTKGDYKAANENYDHAEVEYRAAIQIAESDPATYESLTELTLDRMEMEIYGEGKDISSYFDDSLRTINLALEADPEDVHAFNLQAQLYSRNSEYLRDHGQDPTPLVSKAIASSEQALKITPNIYGYNALVGAYRILATYGLDRGIDPTDSVRKAEEAYVRSVQLDPTDPDTHNTMGICFRALGGYQNRTGKDPRPTLQKAIDAYKKAIQIFPRYSYPHNNMGNTYAEMAAYEQQHGIDPRNNVTEALVQCQAALDINPKFAYPLNNMASALNTQARYEIEHGKDPTSSLQKAIEFAQKGAGLNPEFASVYGNMTHAYETIAEYQAFKDLDPSAAVASAVESGKKALTINPTFATALSSMSAAYVTLGRSQLEHAANPSTALEQSLQFSSQALKNDPAFFDALLYRGLAQMLQGAWLKSRHLEKATLSFAAAEKTLEDAARLKPGEFRLVRAKQELSQITSQH